MSDSDFEMLAHICERIGEFGFPPGREQRRSWLRMFDVHWTWLLENA
jgi:hypothetical protein